MSLRLSLARIGFRWRLAAALVCLLFAGVSVVENRAVPVSRSSGLAVVATRPLAAGHRLVAGDLTVVRPSTAWPGSVARVDRLLGSTLAGPVARGEPVTALRLADQALTKGLRPGAVALPIDVAGDVRGLVHPGSDVDLVAVGETGARSAAHRVLVLAVLPPTDSGAGCRLILAVERDAVPRILAAGSTEAFRVAALPP